jgi:cytidylate kinase
VIVGAAGSGKTTLSRRLGAGLQVPVFHLDEVAADGDRDARDHRLPTDELPTTVFEPRPLHHRRRITESIAATSAWIAEGSFVGWTDPLLARADTIIWLDHVSPLRITRRILTRAKRSHARESRRHRGVSRVIRPRAYVRHGVGLLHELWDVTGYFWRTHMPNIPRDIAERRWDRINRSSVESALEPHWDKVIRVRDLDTFESLDRIVGMPDDAVAADQPAIEA